MNSVVLHPDFERNRLLYFSYVKQRDGGDTTIALARGRFDGKALEARRGCVRRRRVGHGRDGRPRRGRAGRDVLSDRRRSRRRQRHRRRELPHARAGSRQSRRQGAAPARRRHGARRQSVRRPRRCAKPEIYTYGHRNAQGLAWHPQTGELWATEVGPMGGDELNRLVPGQQLRLAARVARQNLHGQSGLGAVVVAARHGDARDVLGAGDQSVEPHDLRRRQVPALAAATTSSAR